MSDRAPRLLFVPVSGPFGMGEYARSLAIAQGAQGRWPGAAVLFVLSREAPYADSTPFPTTLLDSSATFHPRAVAEVIGSWRPDMVIFDNAGRTAQLAAARQCGARVVYISARPRQRRKAFRLRWMRLIDEHWIAYPQFIAGELNFLERLKLKYMDRPQMRFLDVILARPNEAGSGQTAQAAVFERLGVIPGDYTLVVPGGGTGHPGASDAVQIFLQAARQLAAGGAETLFVGKAPPAYADPGVTAGGTRLQITNSLPQSELADLMRGARLIISNGGSTLLQGIACGRSCLAAPVARDQGERIRRCVEAGVAMAAPLDTAAIHNGAVALLQNAAARNALAARALGLKLTDGVEVALRAMTDLLDSN